MAFESITEIPGMSQQMYDDVRRKMGFDSPNAQWPRGLISHCAGPLDNGAWCIVEEWETKEDFQRFCDTQPKDFKMEGLEQMEQKWFRVYHEYHSPKEREIGVSRAA